MNHPRLQKTQANFEKVYQSSLVGWEGAKGNVGEGTRKLDSGKAIEFCISFDMKL